MTNTNLPTNNAGYTIHTKTLALIPLAPRVTIRIIKIVPSTGEHSIMVHTEPGGIFPRHLHLENMIYNMQIRVFVFGSDH